MTDKNDGVTVLPDGSAFTVASFPLQPTHWIYEKGEDGFSMPPPMPFRMGDDEQPATFTMTRRQFADAIWAAGKYAVRGATMGGKEMDFDPDALCQNLVVGMLGYWTPDGLSSDAWANPPSSDAAVGSPDCELRDDPVARHQD